MRDLPKSTTHVVKKASDIFVPGERGLHLYGTDKGLLSPSKVVTNPKNRGGHLVSDTIKKSPSAKQSLPAELALAASRRVASSSSEDENDRGFHVDDEESDEVSSSESTASEVEVGYEEEEDGTTSGRQEDPVDDEESVSKAGNQNGGDEMERSLVIEGDDDIPRASKQRVGKQKDESTCRDEDFTWVNNRGEAPKATIDSDRRSTSHTTVGGRSTRSHTQIADPNLPRSPLSPILSPSGALGCGKPPRPLTGSLDRRRHLGASRHERDSKSRSTHSLKDKSSSSELQHHDSHSSNLSLNSKGKPSKHQHDSGNYNNYNSSGSSHHNNNNGHRQSPGIWEPPPPPPVSHWDPHYYWNWNNHHHSREELRLIDYHRRQQAELYRYGSNGALSSTQDLSCSRGCCNRPYYQPPPQPCCSCEHSRAMWGKDCQRQDTDERLRRLQTDKEALALQVKVLTEQVQTQGTKITDLERTVSEKNQLLSNADDLLQRVSQFAKTVGIQIDKQKEMLSRSSLETQKLELMSAMSELKLQQAALERENLELRSSLINGTPLTNGSLLNSNTLNNNSIAASLLRRTGRMVTSTPGNSINSSPLHHGSHGNLPQQQQHQQLTATSPSPVTPKTPPASYRQRVDLHYSSLPRQAFATTLSTASGSSGGSVGTDANANPKRNVAFAKTVVIADDDGEHPLPSHRPVALPSMSASMSALTLSAALAQSNLRSLKQTSASAQNIFCSGASGSPSDTQLIDFEQDHSERATTEPPAGAADSTAGRASESGPKLAAASSPTLLDREFHQRSKSQPQPFSVSADPIQSTTFRGFSVPNLAESETLSSDRLDGQASQRSYTPQPSPSPSMSHKNLKGLRNIFGKIKRSNSGTLDDVDPGEFKRGGVRATAGARLGWSSEFRQPDKPLKEWNLDVLCQWFDHLGLGMYEEELRRWLKSGGAPELVRASPVDIEKELNLKNPLHRKKIVLAIADLTEGLEGDALLKNAGKLDTPWIIRWLEDLGLPQYKDSFMAARMDGRMLHKLTMDDLVSLHVSSCVHVASLRRGIQLMREQKWNPDCLIRRSMSDENNGTKEDVRLWTCYRVMEWLRAVDLSEYSPNLRGAGVHGALMMYEVKFTAELLAELLSIPPSKTLLRRHLATHFKELLGRDVIQAKRDAENTLGFQPLTLAAKIKTPKKSQFSLKRKKSSKGGDEWSDYVCPMGDSGQEHLPNSQQPPSSSHQSLSTASSSSSSVGVATAATASVATGNNVTTSTSTNTTSATSNYQQQQHHQHNSYNSHQASSPYHHHNHRANTNLVTSNASVAMTKTPYNTNPDSTISSTSSSTATTTSGVGSEVASHQQQLSNASSSNGGSSSNGNNNVTNNNTIGSDSPTSTRSSTTSTS
ncbi:liprin-beta-1 isoform X4 [Aedes albopictus]|uniref:SAM domain-containing protein n=1 Tax=Aedes albopictus TaxID=7160 RepID=A0ABM1YS20_AEDAL|nr:liprin-beta-1 isoform X4 [Aedes albopictus]